MKVIHKFKLTITDHQYIMMREKAKILTAQVQNNEVFIWAEVDTSANFEQRGFFIIGTGNPIPSNPMEYFTTVQLNGFVWHIYEQILKPS